MSFEEFLAKRLPELLRFALVLTGRADTARDLVVEALVRAFPSWAAIGAGRTFATVRTGVVRLYLQAQNPRSDGVDDVLAPLSPPARAALALTVFSGQAVDETAAATGLSVGDVAAVLISARAELKAVDAPTSDDALLDALEDASTATGSDDERARDEVLTALEAAPVAADDPFAVDALFANGEAANDTTTPARRSADLGPGPATLVDPAEEQADVEQDDDVVAPVARRRMSTTSVPFRIVAAALILLLAAGAAVLVAHDRHHAAAAASHAPSARVTSAAPSASATPSPATRVGGELPGTRTLGQHFGSGNDVVRVGRHRAPTGRELAIDAVCSGPGGAAVGPVTLARCDGTRVGATLGSVASRPVVVRADATTTWRFSLVDEPAHGTNGALQFPANPLLRSSSATSTLARADGRGPDSVRLSSGTTTPRLANVRLLLSCTGAGVSFASDDHRFDGRFTRTCFAGWSYEFDVDGVLAPGTLTVRASPETTWRLVVVSA